MDFEKYEKCEKCDGKGVIQRYINIQNGKCFSCNGSGRKKSHNTKITQYQYSDNVEKKNFKDFNNGYIEENVIDYRKEDIILETSLSELVSAENDPGINLDDESSFIQEVSKEVNWEKERYDPYKDGFYSDDERSNDEPLDDE